MRILVFGLSLASLSCSSKISGMCNICPTATFADTAACADAGKKAGCAKAEVVEVTDDACDIGKPQTTHQMCVYSECDQSLDCTMVVRY
jgi:hypothetical protein